MVLQLRLPCTGVTLDDWIEDPPFIVAQLRGVEQNKLSSMLLLCVLRTGVTHDISELFPTTLWDRTLHTISSDELWVRTLPLGDSNVELLDTDIPFVFTKSSVLFTSSMS